jgi:hypothetical protein
VGDWRAAGTYFEVCNCDAICPCRRLDGAPGGASSFGDCRFALSWFIEAGHLGAASLAGMSVVMVGWYDDAEPRSPWRVSLYVDENADDAQMDALTAVFLGRAGGTPMRNFANAIDEVHHVRRARIDLSHQRRRWGIRVTRYVQVSATRPVETKHVVSCGIPGHDQAGEEVVAGQYVVDDDPLHWHFSGRCGYAASFDYRSDEPGP